MDNPREILEAAKAWAEDNFHEPSPWVHYRMWQLRDACQALLRGLDAVTILEEPERPQLTVVRTEDSPLGAARQDTGTPSAPTDRPGIVQWPSADPWSDDPPMPT